MSANKKIEEGLSHIKNAEKSLKTSLLKWRPDYENAADEYNKAATCFRNAKAYEQCLECLLKAVENYKQNRSPFYAAKALEQCILVSKELGDLREISSFASRAAYMYTCHGSIEAAASSLDKSAKILESHDPAEALILYQKAYEAIMLQDHKRQGAEYISKISRLHVKLQEYDLAADAIRRELGLNQQLESYQATGRLAVALVLVQLARGDLVAAEKAFKEWGNYCEAPEVQMLESLLQAYDEEDRESALRALNNPFIKHMDVEYAILARDMPLPQGVSQPAKAAVKEKAAASYKSPNTDKEDEGKDDTKNDSGEEDEYSGGLC